MISRLLIPGLAVGFAGLAQAAPIAKVPAVSSNLIQVAGCTKGTHAVPDGRCRPNIRPPIARKCPPGMYHGPTANASLVIRRASRTARARYEPPVRAGQRLSGDPPLPVAPCPTSASSTAPSTSRSSR